MSLVERWRPPTGVCAVRYKERGEEEEIAHCEEMTVFIWFRTFSFQNSPSPWVSSLPSPPACIMGATPHNLRKIKREGRLGVPACHAFVDMGVYSVCVCVCGRAGIRFHLSGTFPLPLWTSGYSGSIERRSDGSASLPPARRGRRRGGGEEERRCDRT